MYWNNTSMLFDDIANTLNVSKRSVPRVLSERGLNTNTKNRYLVNDWFFDEIDCEEKAYILGLLYSDGYVGDSHFNNISISMIDYDIINFVQSKLIKKGDLIRKIDGGYSEISVSDMYVLNFSSIKMATKLRDRYGFTQDKSYTLESIFKNVDDKYKHHVLRGYFDGDGSVYLRKNKQKSPSSFISISGTVDVVNEIKDFCNHSGIINQHTPSKEVWYYKLYSYADVKSFYQMLYKDATVWLHRKREKFYCSKYFKYSDLLE